MAINKLRNYQVDSTLPDVGASSLPSGFSGRPLFNIYPTIPLDDTSVGSGFLGVFADDTALLLSTPTLNNIAYVEDTDGITGGSTGLGGSVYYNGTTWEVYQLDASAGTPDTIGSHNGASFRYSILTGTPTVTYVTTTADQPVLTVSGGTIKLKELWVPYDGTSGANPIWTINGTVSASQFLSTPKVFKVIENSTTPTIAGTYNQLDIDNTPQVRYGDFTSTSMKVQLASVTGTWQFNFSFTMNQ